MPILVFLRLSVLDLGRPDLRDRKTDVRRAPSLNAPYPRDGGIIISTLGFKYSRVGLKPKQGG